MTDAFRLSVRRWFRENLPPGWGTPEYQPPLDEAERAVFLRDWQRRLFDGGWAGLSWPREYGGRGASIMEQAVFLEERDLARAPYDLGISGTGGVGPMLIEEGTEDQKKRYLEPMLRGDELWCQGFSEPGAGSDLASLTTRAEASVDGFIVNGQKVWTSRAMWCDQMMMLVRTDPDAPKHRGLSALITPMKVPGLTVRPIKQINGAVEFAEVFFDDLFVPPENLIGGLGDGWRVALATLRHERITATRAFEAARMVSDLIADTQPSDDPLVRVEVARLYAETLAARVSYLRMIEREQRTGDTGGTENAGTLHVNELVQRIAELGSGACGPDLPRSPVVLREGVPDWSFDFLNTRRYTIGGGTSQILRNIVGERVLGLPK